MTDTPKARTKNAALFAVESKDANGKTITLAYVRSTSTAEAKSALPITARRLSFDEASDILRSTHAIIGMREAGDGLVEGDKRQLDAFADTVGPRGQLPIDTQDVDHEGALDKSDLPPVKTVNEALAAGVKVRDDS